MNKRLIARLSLLAGGVVAGTMAILYARQPSTETTPEKPTTEAILAAREAKSVNALAASASTTGDPFHAASQSLGSKRPGAAPIDADEPPRLTVDSQARRLKPAAASRGEGLSPRDSSMVVTAADFNSPTDSRRTNDAVRVSDEVAAAAVASDDPDPLGPSSTPGATISDRELAPTPKSSNPFTSPAKTPAVVSPNPRSHLTAEDADPLSAPGSLPVNEAPATPLRSERATTNDLLNSSPAASAPSAAVAPAPPGVEGAGRPGAKKLEGLQAPAVSIQKTAPAEIKVGKACKFEITVRNGGQVPAHEVEVRDTVPKGTRLLGTNPKTNAGTAGEILWKLGSLKPGEEITLEMQLLPLIEGEIGSVATVHFAAEASARAVATRPELVMQVSGPRDVLVGEQVKLTIKLSNPGTGAASGIILEEQVPSQLTHPAGGVLESDVGELAPNESRELELILTASKPGKVINRIAARGEGSLRAEQQVEFEVLAPALNVAVNGPKRRFLDREATYAMSVSNPGTAPAKEVSLVAHLPRGMKFVKANNAGQFDPQTRTVQWLLDELPAKETGVVELVAMPTEAGELTMRLEGAAQKGLQAKFEQPVLVEGVAAVLFEVVDVNDPIEIGGETSYEIRVVNQGSKTAANVRVTAFIPPEMKVLGAEGATKHGLDAARVEFEPLAQLAPKADATYTVRVQGVKAGDSRLRVQVQTDDMAAPVTKEESTRVYADE